MLRGIFGLLVEVFVEVSSVEVSSEEVREFRVCFRECARERMEWRVWRVWSVIAEEALGKSWVAGGLVMSAEVVAVEEVDGMEREGGPEFRK